MNIGYIYKLSQKTGGMNEKTDIPVGTKALILSKLYFGVLSKSLESLEIERYYSVLYFLSHNNGCTQQHICNNLAVDKTAMVKVINYLAKAGYLKITKNPDDRREHFINLTKKGLRRTEEVIKAFNNLDKEMFSDLTKDEKENFLKLLQLISDKLQSMPGKEIFFNYMKTGAKQTTKTPSKQ